MALSLVSLRWLVLALVFAMLPSAVAWAQSSAPLRVVLSGHDPVAYFVDGRPVKGSPEIKNDWDGARYLFSSAANRDKFAADPERYAPQFAGFCTASMAGNVRREADPQAWLIVDGKLFVFGLMKSRDMVAKDPKLLAEKAAAAGENWHAMR